MRASISPRMPVSAPSAPLATRARSSSKGLSVCMAALLPVKQRPKAPLLSPASTCRNAAKPESCRGLSRIAPISPSAEKMLGDLHGVEGRALEELVARNEERDRAAAGVADVVTDPADQHVALAGRLVRHRKMVARGVVDKAYARRRGKNLT